MLPPIFFLKWTNIKVVGQSRNLSFVEFTKNKCKKFQNLYFFFALTKNARKSSSVEHLILGKRESTSETFANIA